MRSIGHSPFGVNEGSGCQLPVDVRSPCSLPKILHVCIHPGVPSCCGVGIEGLFYALHLVVDDRLRVGFTEAGERGHDQGEIRLTDLFVNGSKHIVIRRAPVHAFANPFEDGCSLTHVAVGHRDLRVRAPE